MPVEFLSDAMRRIVGSQQDAEELGSGFGGPNGPTEGPVWIAEHGYLLFSDIHGSRRMKWTPDGGISVDKENTERANGMTRDPQGRLVVCHHWSRRVDREG
jgi:gluconolactonase